MTPEQKLKHMILIRHAQLIDAPPPKDAAADNIDALFEETDGDNCELQDARSEVRCGLFETEISAPSSRHYEAQSVAAKAPDGTWVGWTYWYGGGKHGEPEAIDWMNEAYDLTCSEEEKVVTVRTFSRAA